MTERPKGMSLKEFFSLVWWDWHINRGITFDRLRSMLLLLEIRWEQFIYRNCYRPRNPLTLIWYLTRFLGSIFQWVIATSIIPGDAEIGRGLRLPHPQNIIVTRLAKIGDFCTLYQNVSIALNGFNPTKAPRLGDRVMLGTGSIVIGDITIGSDVIVSAGAVVLRSVPDHARVISPRPTVITDYPSRDPAEPGSKRHIEDPYSLWR
ncbi:MAG: serine acetyltransferase [Anaerolineales bacterium]|nr:serine acetyltransferase [Anaerolineales bacterium]MCX7608330.1 serine acetyltransferase [Anaerolineales bacterium]MDW8226232.1 serine acetyltransferase [Anaerolineales bacterium]